VSPEAKAIGQALLDHHKNISRVQGGSIPRIDACFIPYGDLCERAGVPQVKSSVGKFLREIAQWCQENAWPPLNALAVNHDTRRPGRGYDNAPGCSLQNWANEVAACIRFEDYPDLVQ
jgi:hypothetical protein